MRSRTVAASALTLALLAMTPLSAAAAPAPDSAELTLLATTDVHGNVLNWDYFANKPFPAGQELGMSRASTLIKGVKEERGSDSVVLVDNGDTIQGNPLAYYYAKQEPITETGETHPMAKTFNHLGYDAQVAGNHEFNYGLDLLKTYTDQAKYPVLGANVINDSDGSTRLEPYTLVDKQVGGKTVTVGILGVTTPGSRIWDKNNLQGKVHFDDPVETATTYVPKMKEAGADVVVVLSHSGKDPEGQDWDPSKLQENVSTSVASVPGVDVLVAGHTHRNEPSQVVTRDDGSQVLITQPNYWARSVSEVELPIDLESMGVNWGDAAPKATELATQGDVAEDQKITDLVDSQHKKTIDYVNTRIGSVSETLSASTSYYEDTAILDFISNVQTQKVEEALKDSKYKDLPVLSQASPFSRTAEFPAGDITIRDVAGLYVFDNTLSAVEVDGKQLRDYLEFSARYFQQTEEGAEFDPATGTNAVDEASGAPIPDYNYDALSGIDYNINVSQPVGQRIENLSTVQGKKIADGDKFVLALNNYRQSGGGDYPVGDLPEIYNEQLEIRQALIDWVEDKKVVDPKDFFSENWRIVTSTRDDGDDSAGVDGDDSAEVDGGANVDGGNASSDSDSSDSVQGTDDGSTSTNAGNLPRTGTDPGLALWIAAGAIAIGGALVVLARRRTSNGSNS